MTRNSPYTTELPFKNPPRAMSPLVLVLAVVLAACVWLVFNPAKEFGFLNYDDNQYVQEIPKVAAGLNPSSIVWAFSHSHVGQWHPLTTISWMTDVSLFGLNGGGGFHMHNVILHMLATVLLFLAMRSLTGAIWRSALVAALFGLHPLRVESVAWIAERKDVLSGVFMMGTLWAYAAYARRPASWERMGIVCVIFALGLLAKPMLVTLPVVLLLLDVWPLKRIQLDAVTVSGERKSLWQQALPLIVEKIPLFVLSLAASVITIRGQGEHFNPIAPLKVAQRLSYIPGSYVHYLIKLVWPVNLSAHYPYSSEGPAVWVLAASTLILIAITVLVFRIRKSHLCLLVGWLWFIITLLPVIGIFYNGIQIRADRYTYVSQIGLILAAVWIAWDLVGRNKSVKIAFAVVAPILLVVLMICSSRQVMAWESDRALWENCVAHTKDNFYAHSKLGKSLQDLKNYAGAEEQYRAALKLNPDGIEALNNLASILAMKGEIQEALELQRRTLVGFPNWHLMHHNLGQHLVQSGDYSGAKSSYLRALELEPKSFVTSYQLASMLAEKLGDKASLEEAATTLGKAIQHQPQQTELHILLGNILSAQGRIDEAIASFRKTLEIDPKHSVAENNLGALLVAKGMDDEAMKWLKKAIQDNAGNIDAYDNLAQTLIKKGQSDEAVKILRSALNRAPNHAGCHIRLAWVLATSPVDSIRNGLEATQLAHRAEEFAGKNVPDVLDSLAAAYAETGRFTEAREAAMKALEHPVMQNNPERAAQIRKHLEMYRSGQPFRDVVAQYQGAAG